MLARNYNYTHDQALDLPVEFVYSLKLLHKEEQEFNIRYSEAWKELNKNAK